jgi:hypothetical protein
VANWLLHLTDNHRSWGFGLCYLCLRNVRGFKWNQKRVCRIYKELELNLRIRPKVIRFADLGFCHNDPEYISDATQNVAADWGIRLEHFQPENHQQNAYVERL